MKISASVWGILGDGMGEQVWDKGKTNKERKQIEKRGDGIVLAGTSECEVRWETLAEIKWCGARLTQKHRCIKMVLKLTCDVGDKCTVRGNRLVLIPVNGRLQDTEGGKLLS